MHQSTSTHCHESTPELQPTWSLRVVLLDDPFMDVYNSKDANKMQLIMVPLALNAQQFVAFLHKEFPFLGEHPFEVDKSRKLHVLTCSIKTPSAIKALGELGRSALYIRPQMDKEITHSDPDELSEINTPRSVEEARAAVSAFADTLGVMGAFTYIRNVEERG
ncbi:uncharacterized protein LOC127427128 isoform X2 [Myxocyprinus asiaticus]|nr:uncharacterized protein LOC127427128 isoform X2 [Myxocyprinus asiaticus]